MPQKQCEKCGEMVDDAKAFCPGCGSPLVAEQARETESNFDSMDSTVQFGQTMYNQMLSDMGLNIKAAPQSPESVRLEPERKIEIVIEPAAAPPTAARSPQTPIPTESKSSRKWWIIAAAALVLLFLLLVVIAVAAYLLLPQLAR